MASALQGAASCARCAAPVRDRDVRCVACGVLLEPVAAGSAVALPAGPLLGVVPARGDRRRLAVATDLLLVVAAGAAAVVGLRSIGTGAGLVPVPAAGAGALVALVVLSGLLTALRASGRSCGRALLGLRTVDALSGLPARSPAAALLALTTGRGRTVVTADLRRGRDPRAALIRPERSVVDPPLERDGSDAVPPAASGRPVAAASSATGGARLVSDSGDRIVVVGPVLLGRAPEPTRGVRTLHALPDLSRGVARTHLLADFSNGLLWITDLGSPGGTTIRSGADDGRVQPLLPQVRTAVAAGWQVRVGGRTLTVSSLGAEEVAAGG